MTRTELLDDLRRLTPTQRRTVLTAALAIRAARDAGDPRPAEVIAAHLMQPGRHTVLH